MTDKVVIAAANEAFGCFAFVVVWLMIIGGVAAAVGLVALSIGGR